MILETIRIMILRKKANQIRNHLGSINRQLINHKIYSTRVLLTKCYVEVIWTIPKTLKSKERNSNINSKSLYNHL